MNIVHFVLKAKIPNIFIPEGQRHFREFPSSEEWYIGKV